MPTVLRALMRATVLAGALAAIAPPALCADVAGVRFEERSSVAGSDLTLNGAGLRTRLLIKVYAMGLYLPRRTDSAEGVLGLGGPKRIQIVTLRDLTPEQFADALIDGLRKNHSEAEFSRLQARSEELRAALLGLGSTPGGTQIRLDWQPAAGTRLIVGNEARGKDIPGEDFYRALLRIWLGDKPVDAGLKNTLLGKG